MKQVSVTVFRTKYPFCITSVRRDQEEFSILVRDEVVAYFVPFDEHLASGLQRIASLNLRDHLADFYESFWGEHSVDGYVVTRYTKPKALFLSPEFVKRKKLMLADTRKSK